MTPHRPKTYVLHLWFEADKTLEEGGKWRFWLEEPRTQKRWGFTSLEQLSCFLTQAMRQNETPFVEGDENNE